MSDKPEVKLEQRYVVFKFTDIDSHLSKVQQAQLHQMDLQIAIGRADEGKAPFDSLVIENDWPEFALAWDAIKTRMEAEQGELK